MAENFGEMDDLVRQLAGAQRQIVFRQRRSSVDDVSWRVTIPEPMASGLPT